MKASTTARLLFPLLLLGLADAVQASEAEDGTRITGSTTCNEPEMIVGENLTIVAGAKLELVGCVLRLNSPPYEDQPSPAKDEGLTVRLERGASLILKGLPGRPAGIARANESYGYTIKSDGYILSEGMAESPNFITGLEGAQIERFVTGGLQQGGVMELRHTRFEKNTGPSVFLLRGGSLEAENVIMTGTGIIATRATALRVANSTFLTHSTGLSVSLTPAARLDNSTIHAGAGAVFGAVTNWTIMNSKLDSNRVAIELQNAALRVRSSSIGYNQFAVGTSYRPSYGARQANEIDLYDVDLDPSPNATHALNLTATSATLERVNIPAHPSVPVYATTSRVRATDVEVHNSPAWHLIDPPEARIMGSSVGADGPTIEVYRSLAVVVRSSEGAPLGHLEVEAAGARGETDHQGRANLAWRWLSTNELTELPWNQTIPVKIRDPERNLEWDRSITANLYSVEFAVEVDQPASSPAPGVFIFIALLAVAFRLRFSQKIK